MSLTFNRVAPFYEFGEKFFFGGLLDSSRTFFKEKFKDSRSILLLGEGRGSFLHQLLESNQLCDVTIVDSSSAMIRYQKSRIAKENLNRVCFKCMALEDFASTKEFDLICSFFFWDCFVSQQIDYLVPKCSHHLKKDGFWINSDFQDLKTFSNGFNYFKVRLMYMFFNFTTGIHAWRVEPFQKYAEGNGLRSLEIKEIEKNYIYTELFQKLI